MGRRELILIGNGPPACRRFVDTATGTIRRQATHGDALTLVDAKAVRIQEYSEWTAVTVVFQINQAAVARLGVAVSLVKDGASTYNGDGSSGMDLGVPASTISDLSLHPGCAGLSNARDRRS